MPKLPSSKHIVAVLLANSFIFISQKGSHAKYRKIGKPTLTAIVPVNRKEMPLGTARSIARQAQMDFKDFQK